MFLAQKAYLYQGQTVVLNKSDIEDAQEDQFQEVTVYISRDFIIQEYEALDMFGELED